MALVTNLQATPYPIESITKMGQYEDFNLQVVRNQIMGHKNVNINGYNTSVGATAIPLWENSSAYVFPSTALTMSVVSSSALDTGGAKVQIVGLDANWDEISEVITLTGITPVTTTLKYLRINSVIMTAAASGQPSNAGIITVTNSGTVYGQINVGLGRSQMSIYSIPAGYTGYVRRINAWSGSTAVGTNWVVYNFFYQNNGLDISSAQVSFFQFIDVHRFCPLVYQEKTDLVWMFNSSNEALQSVALYAEMLLIQNDGQALASAI
jgi:hypothetical protein